VRGPARSAAIPTALAALPSLRVNVQWTLAGTAVYTLSQWGMLTALAKLGSPEMVGMYALGIAVSAPVLAIGMLQLRAIQVSDVRGEFAFADYLGLRIAATLAGLCIIAACAWMSGLGGGGRGYDAAKALVVLWVGVGKSIDSINDIIRGLFQREERMDLSAISLMIKGPAALLALWAILVWTDDLVLAVASTSAVWLVALLAFDLPKARALLVATGPGRGAGRLRPRWNRRVLGRLITVSLPLGLTMLLASLQVNIPRYVLELTRGTAELGYFAAMIYPTVAVTIFIGALGQSALPRLSRFSVSDRAGYRRLLQRLVGLAGCLGLAFVAAVLAMDAALRGLLGQPLLAVLYSADYAAYFEDLILVTIAAAIQLVTGMLGYGLTAARSFRLQAALAAASCAVTALVAALLVPGHGVRGAALTVLVTSVVMGVGFAMAVRWTLREVRSHGA
jgi:O-antigen/teichoic acid export membrane protein